MGERDTYAKRAKGNVCAISLRDLSFCRSAIPYVSEEYKVPLETYQQIVLYTPTEESNLGQKISKKLEKHIDELVDEILDGLDVKHHYFFSAYQPKDKSKIDLKQAVLSQSEPFLMLYCPDSFLVSLYSSIRNALAHGNILKYNDQFWLFALAKSEDGTRGIDSKLSFLLKINKLEKLHTYMDAFGKYN